MSKRAAPLLLLSVLALSVILARMVPSSLGIANVYVYPRVVTAEPGENVRIDIKISGGVEVYGWEIKLNWTSSVLNYSSATEGSFLKGIEQNPTNFIIITYEDQVGNDTIALACARQGYVSGVDGSGTLASVTFNVEVDGETVLDLFNTKLADSRPTPYPIDHTSTDGLFSNIAGFPIARFSFAPLVAVIDETIVFDGSASSDPDGTIVRYFWDFGDDSNFSAIDPYASHVYSEGGTFPVTLQVTDNEGWNGTLRQEAKVRFARDVVITSISVSVGTATAGDKVAITVRVMNDGSETVSFRVTAYYAATTGVTDPKEISYQTVSDLAMAQSKTLTFDWDTSGIVEGNYRTRAVAETLSGETKITDNAKWGSEIKIEPAPAFPWTIVGGAVGAVAVVGVLGFFFMRRRRQNNTKPL